MINKSIITKEWIDKYDSGLKEVLQTSFSKKIDKEDNKQLSSNDYTTEEKNKLAGIENGAEINVLSDWNINDTDSDSFIKNKPAINDAVLNIKKNNTNIGTFTANASFDSDVNITFSISELTDGSRIDTLEDNVNSTVNIGYGIKWNESNTTPVRTGNLMLHKSLPIQSKMRRCMLNDDGSVYGYIDPEDYTKYTNGETVDYTGAHGQYMVEVPEYWYEATTETVDGVKHHSIIIYPTSAPGTKHSPKVYVGAVEASSNDSSSDTTKKLFSICTANINYDTDGAVNANSLTYSSNSTNYRGGNRNNSTYGDNTIKSLLGRPVTSLTQDGFRTRAAARGAGWTQLHWFAWMSIVRLYVVEYCSFNGQATFNPSKTSEGYMQGGLGAGVSNINSTDWNNFNDYNPFVPCGITKKLGNSTGIVKYKYAANEISTYSYTFDVPSYRGIENPWGHIWKFTDGISIYGDSTNNVSYVYTTDDITKFVDPSGNNTTPGGYKLRTSSAVYGTEGFIKTWLSDDNGDFIPLTQGGSNSSYLYDYSWLQNSGWKILISGGGVNSGSGCGWFCFAADLVSGYAGAYRGGRLYYNPTE